MSTIPTKLDQYVDGLPLRERLDRFAIAFVAGGNRNHAYREGFVVDERKTVQWITRRADELLQHAWVRERIAELEKEALEASLISVRRLINDWAQIIEADPNELSAYRHDACRYCWGTGGAYHWVDEYEYLGACAAAFDDDKAGPTDAGGYGFDPRREPNMDCRRCFGRGDRWLDVADTTKLSGAARKLFLGVKQTKNGIEVVMADKEKAREQLGRAIGMLGADAVPYNPTAPKTEERAAPRDIVDATRTYARLARREPLLTIVQGGKPG